MTGAGFALLVVIFYVVVAVMIACEMHAADPVDQLTDDEVEQDWVDMRIAELEKDVNL